MIHNGIIENYAQIKTELSKKGYTFTSDTDTEVLLNFIEDIRNNNNCSLEEALRIALKKGYRGLLHTPDGSGCSGYDHCGT